MSIEFSSKSNTHQELSNFYPAPFLLEGKIWPSVEHYFQAQKFPTDLTLQERIRLATTPQSAKHLGRTKSEHFRTDWNERREYFMEKALEAKFAQNPTLQEILKSTYNFCFFIKKTAIYKMTVLFKTLCLIFKD